MALQLIGQCGGCSQELAEEEGTPSEQWGGDGGLLAMCEACDFYREEIETAGLPFALEVLRATHAHEEAFYGVAGHTFDFVEVYRQKAEWNADGKIIALHAADAECLAEKEAR